MNGSAPESPMLSASVPAPAGRSLRHRGLWIVRAYYWLAPAFLAVYLGAGIDLRFPFLDAIPGASVGYYLAQSACALIITRRPGLTSTIGRLESSINIGTLVVSTWAAYLGVLAQAASDTGVIHNPFTPVHVASLLTSAAVLSLSHIARTVNPR